ncbi:Hypothetical predicted protein [Cloeon dipterum]|uniref:Uncharacterized protein n=1 Tax=Cloeon dipterum TaxID=197152 RepID=A0A8S1DPD3_9INSE|nr:Hypothetical predicted protein [Cloeon dipterum]
MGIHCGGRFDPCDAKKFSTGMGRLTPVPPNSAGQGSLDPYAMKFRWAGVKAASVPQRSSAGQGVLTPVPQGIPAVEGVSFDL